MSTTKKITPVKNPETGVFEISLDAKVISISNSVKMTKSTKRADGVLSPYQIGQVEVFYPNGTTKKVGASIWTNSLLANPDSFVPGSDVSLRIQLLDNGTKFYNKIELPSLGAHDVDALMGGIDWALIEEDAEALVPDQEGQ